MIKFVAKVAGMSQKYTVDKDERKHTFVTLKLEVKDGFEEIPNLSEYLNKPMNVQLKPIQPGLTSKEE